MKEGDEVICIESDNTILTVGKKYTVVKVYTKKISIFVHTSPRLYSASLYGKSSYLKSRFRTIEELRDEKINSIISENE
jgi:hypothetical protein